MGISSGSAELEPLRADQGVDKIDREPGRNRGAEYVIEQHLTTPSHAFAGGQIGEADAEHPRNEDEPENVEH
jgi:hypothetical protein